MRDPSQSAPVPGEYSLGADEWGSGMVVMKLSDVPDEQVNWIWPYRILDGRGNILSGEADCGKSTVAFDICARITTGMDWPDGAKNTDGPRTVLLCVSEDGHGDTVKPRLRAAKADLDRVVMFRHVDDLDEEGKPIRRSLSLKDDIRKMERAMKEHQDIRLIVIDPITSFFGDVNLNKDDEVRPVMDALKAFMEKHNVAILAILHSNKRSDVGALGKISGATSVGAAWRVVWAFQTDPDDDVMTSYSTWRR